MNKLKQIRLSHKYSMGDMALFLEISKTFYYQIESGKRRLSYLMSLKISKIFGLKPDELFYEDFVNMLLEKEQTTSKWFKTTSIFWSRFKKRIVDNINNVCYSENVDNINNRREVHNAIYRTN